MKNASKQTGYRALLRDPSVQGFLWTQFLGAFNDNVYKMIVSVGAVELAANPPLGGRYLALAGAIFVIPFILFAGWAGQIADRFSKTRVLQIVKALEMVVMLFGLLALEARSLNMLLVALFGLAMQANLFSPAKYGILPEMLDETQISRANGLLEFSTFAAIVLGTGAGSFLFAAWRDRPLWMGGVLLAIAILGAATSLLLRVTPASGAREPFHWNPLRQVWTGTLHIRRARPQWLTVAGISYFWFIGALFQLTVILLGKETLHLPEIGTGLLITALAAGIGAGSLAAGWISGDHTEVGLAPCGAVALGACSLLLAGAHSFHAIAFWLAASGFSGGIYIVPLNAFLQRSAASKEMGRLQAVNNFWNAVGIALASAVLYLLHDVFHRSPSWILGAVGAASLAATACITRTAPAPAARLFLCAASRLFFRVRAIGAGNIPAVGGALLVSNHMSYADAILIAGATPRLIRFLMWEPIYRNRWLNPICRLFQAIPLPTHSPKQSLHALKAAQAELKAGRLVCIFPEGELASTPQVETFQRGVELLARGLEDVPVVPVHLGGLWGHPLSRAADHERRGIRRWFRWEVTVSIGQPMRGPFRAEELQQRVLELASQAAGHQKRGTSTLAFRFVRCARKRWSAAAVADSSGRQLNFGETLTGASCCGDGSSKVSGNRSTKGFRRRHRPGGALANLGVTLAGKTAVNLNFTAGQDAIGRGIEQCGVRTVVSSRLFLAKANLPELDGAICLEDLFSLPRMDKARAAVAARWQPVRSLARRIRPEDLAAVLFSSGSTGAPQGVMLSRWNVLSNLDATAQAYPVGSPDCMLRALPVFHCFGLLENGPTDDADADESDGDDSD